MTTAADLDPAPEPYDLRLLPAAVGAWAVSALVLETRPLVAVGMLIAVAVLAAAAWVSARRGGARPPTGSGVAVVAAALACTAAATAVAGLQLQAVRAGPLAELARAGATVTVTAVLLEDPRLLTARPQGPVLGRPLTLVRVRVRALERPDGQVGVSVPVLVLSAAADWAELLPGQRIRLRGRLLPPRRGDDVAAVLSARGPPQLTGRPPALQRAAGRVRASMRQASDVLPVREAGLLPGLVLGDVSRLDPELNDSFRTAGLTHLTAVSGANVAIVLGAVLLAARQCRVGLRLQALLCALALFGFVVLVRPSPSVLRAAAMGAVAIVALASGRPRAALPALCAATLVLLLTDPWLALSLGFALSVSATAGLLTLAPGWRRRLARRLPGWLADAIAVPAAAQAACCPLIAAISASVSLVAIPANLLAAPLIAPATLLGVLAALTAPWCLPVARVLAELAGVPVRLLVRVAVVSAGLPGASIPWPGGLRGALALLVLITTAGFLLRYRAGRRSAAVAGVAALLALSVGRVVTPSWPPADWQLVACDIGQGDMLALSAGPGAAVVVDAGPDPALADACLKTLRVRVVPVLVLSHLHADHVEGLPGVLRGRRVGTVQTGPLDEPPGELAHVRAALARAHLTLGREAPGELHRVGAVSWRVLAPSHAFTGTDSDPNNSSLVMSVQLRGFTALLTGDVELSAQQELLAHPELLRADVLKVPHHGSRVQDPAFLAAVHERLSVTSVGLGNDYGHPSAETLGRITGTGARSFRTDMDGAIAITSRSGRLVAVTRGARNRSAALAPATRTGPVPAGSTVAALPPLALTAVAARAAPTGRFASPVWRTSLARAGLGPWAGPRSFDRPQQPGTAAPRPRQRAPPARGRGLPGPTVRRFRAVPAHLPVPAAVPCFACPRARVQEGVMVTAADPPPVTLVLGDEELFVVRAVSAVVLSLRAQVPDADVRDLAVPALAPGQLTDLLTPSLFGDRRVVALRDVQDAGKDVAAHLQGYGADPLPEIALVLVHSGAARNKPLVQGMRDAGARVVDCAKVTRPAERSAFVADEVRRAGREITAEAVTALQDAVGTDLRELATAAGQLVADTTGLIDEPVVARYHRGRAEVTGFLVADRAVEGDLAGAIEALRWAAEQAVAPVLVNSAIAGNLRAIARVAGAGRGSAYSLAKSLGMPAWKVERAQRWARAWTPDGLRAAVVATALADAGVKGGDADTDYTLEQAVRRVAAARAL